MPEELTPDRAMRLLTRRYKAAPEALIAVLCPLLVELKSIDKNIFMAADTNHLRASFTVQLTQENSGVLVPGRTGKFVPAGFGGDMDPGWREIAKGRITAMDYATGIAEGEIYLGFGGKDREILELALSELTTDCFLEIDQYGAAAKALSGLTEYYLVQHLQAHGYEVVRMPEDMAAHLGAYANYDFQVVKNNVRKRLEAKSLWGTDTRYARLIHSTTTPPKGPKENWTAQEKLNYYPTSSCKFGTQDFFAVSLFLRTGSITEFAFARSVSRGDKAHGLPPNRKFPDHVSQNPLCSPGDGTWFSTMDEVWGLD
jgi:hypothetical protein